MTRVVVVTGASAGVGRAVRRDVRPPRRPGGAARPGPGRPGRRRAAVEAAGGTALAIPTDVADYAQVEKAAARVEDELGPIDVWVNVAMTSVLAAFVDVEPDEFRRVTEVTYLGYVYGTRAALDRMRPRNRGAIVQVGSALAYRGIPLQSAYCGAKHATQGFHDSLAHRAAGRAQRCQRDDGADARAEHAAVRLGALPAAAQGAAGAADLPARGGCAGGRVRRRPPPSAGVLGRGHDRRDHRGERGRPGAARPLPGPDRHHGPAGRRARGPRPARQPVRRRSTPTATTARTAGSTTARTHAARSSGCRSTTGSLGAVAGVVAGAGVVAAASASRRRADAPIRTASAG